MRKTFSIGILLGVFSTVALAAYVPYSVTSGQNKERIERAKVDINCNSSTTVLSQSGSWITSCACQGTGDVICTIATGVFSAAPACTYTAQANNNVSNSGQAPTATSFRARTRTLGDVDANDTFYVMCMGPR